MRSFHGFLASTSAALLTGLLILPSVRAQDSVTPISLYGINYNTRQGPDWDPNRCKNGTQVAEDLALVSKITSRVRILSCSDCLQGPVVLNAAKKLGLQLWFGLWASNDTTAFQEELTCLKQIVGSFGDAVLGVSVGSEAVYRGAITPAQSVAYLQATKQVMSDAGRDDLPVAICDVDDTYETHPKMMNATDIVLANAFPFWEGVEVYQAVDYLVNEKLVGGWDVAKSYGKDFILSETGWASDGYDKATSVASPENQVTYFQDFFCTVDRQEKWKYFWFCMFDTAWRIQQDGNPDSVEGHFGIFYANSTIKEHFASLKFNCDGSGDVYAFVLDGAAPRPTAPSPAVPTVPTAPTAPSSTVPTAPSPNGTAAVPTVAPASKPQAQPTRSPKPTTTFTAASCGSNPQCKDLGLTGECCPTVDDVFLICCDNIPTQALNATSSPAGVTNPKPATPSSAAVGGAPSVAPASPGTPATNRPAPSAAGAGAPYASPLPAIPAEGPTAPSAASVPDNVGAPTEGGFGSDAPSAVPTYEGGGSPGSPTVPPTNSQAPTPSDATLPKSTSGAVATMVTGWGGLQRLVVGSHVVVVVLSYYLFQ